MAPWKPKGGDPVGASEVVGRRLFDEPKLVGVQDPKPFAGLALMNFVEKRDPEFSLDRLGRSAPEAGVLTYLQPRAQRHGGRFTHHKTFGGWATLQVKHLLKPPTAALKPPGEGGAWSVTASPISGEPEPLDNNLYHAHIVLPEGDSYTNAYRLRELFVERGGVHKLAPTLPARIRRFNSRDLGDYISTRLGWVLFWRK